MNVIDLGLTQLIPRIQAMSASCILHLVLDSGFKRQAGQGSLNLKCVTPAISVNPFLSGTTTSFSEFSRGLECKTGFATNLGKCLHPQSKIEGNKSCIPATRHGLTK